jgi:hypothetical protein
VQVQMQMLRAGAEIAVVAGKPVGVSVGEREAQTVERFRLCLSLNACRLARASAPLGFVSPEKLNHGISLANLSGQGGSVPVACVRVVAVASVAARLYFGPSFPPPSSASSSSAPPQQQQQQQQQQIVVLDSPLLQEYSAYSCRGKTAVAEALLDHPDLSLSALLEDLGEDDSDLGAACLAMERGGDPDQILGSLTSISAVSSNGRSGEQQMEQLRRQLEVFWYF